MELQKPSGVGGGEAQQPQHETPNNKTLPLETLTKPPSTLLLPPEEAAQAAGKEVAVGQKETKPSSASEVSSHQATAAGAAAGSDLEKKLRRAERFGMPVQLSEEEKRSSRAERFGTASASLGKADVGKISTGKEEEEKRKARAERFGLTGQSPPDEEAKKKARLERFTQNPKPDSVEEEKRKARAARFSGTANASPETNGKPKAEQKTNAVETKGGD